MGDNFSANRLEYIILGGSGWKDVIKAKMILLEMDLVLGEGEDRVVFLAWANPHADLDGVIWFGIHF